MQSIIDQIMISDKKETSLLKRAETVKKEVVKKYHVLFGFMRKICFLFRGQRCLLVQTEDQYIFIHDALVDFLESGDTEVEANELREYIKKQSQVDDRSGLCFFF